MHGWFFLKGRLTHEINFLYSWYDDERLLKKQHQRSAKLQRKQQQSGSDVAKAFFAQDLLRIRPLAEEGILFCIGIWYIQKTMQETEILKKALYEQITNHTMKTTLKVKNVSLTEAMEAYVEEKITSSVKKALGTMDTPAVKLHIEAGLGSRHHRKGDVWQAQATLQWGKQTLRAETSGESFQAAVDLLKEEFVREVKKRKGKQGAQARRGARRAKKNATVAKAARFYRTGRIREEGR
jgi:ribosomal subunit interface protein